MEKKILIQPLFALQSIMKWFIVCPGRIKFSKKGILSVLMAESGIKDIIQTWP